MCVGHDREKARWRLRSTKEACGCAVRTVELLFERPLHYENYILA